MNRIKNVFEKLTEKNEKAFVPYIMAGDGGLETLPDKILFLEKCGVSAIEIGIPFSDPVADGPTIQLAGNRALKNGVTLRDVLTTIKEIRPIVTIPLIVMTYMNPVYAYGISSFVKDTYEAGVDGCIIPDLPLEEEEIIVPLLEQNGIDFIRLVTLTSPLKRIEEIASRGKGFLYAVTVTGTTGVRSQFRKDVGSYLKKIKEVSPIPVLAGFGISTPDHVRHFSQYCDGVIVGSKIVDAFHKGNLEEIKMLVRSSKKVTI